MRISICGSMFFSKEMLEVQKKLQALGFDVCVPTDTNECIENPELNMALDYCMATDVDKKNFDQVAAADAIVVLNYPKNNINGYVGGATLMEIGLARHLNKKIFLLHKIPPQEQLRYALEIEVARPIILNGDIERINEYL